MRVQTPAPPIRVGNAPSHIQRMRVSISWPDQKATIKFTKALRKEKVVVAVDGYLLEGNVSTG